MRTLLLLCFSAALAACGSKNDSAEVGSPGGAATGTTSGTTSGTPTGGSTTEPPRLSIYQFSVDFGWEDAAGQTRSVTVDGTTVPSELHLRLGTPLWGGNSDAAPEHFCTISWAFDGESVATFAGSDAYFAAFEFDFSGTSPTSDDCTPRLGTDFLSTSLDEFDTTTWVLRFGVGGALGADPAPYVLPAEAFGAEVIRLSDGFHTTTTTTPTAPDLTSDWAWADQVDGSFAVTLDGNGDPTPIAAGSVQSGTVMADGHYHLRSQRLTFFPPNFD